MFVVFEGIDGSGKTTLSGKVAAELESRGLSVHQARPKGELKSRLAANIRTLARDPRNLTMSPHTELFLYIARDTQTIDTVIRPSLDKAEVVIADRYLYSPLVLCRARGVISMEEIQGAIDVAARGLWPDLVVYCDVDIDTSAIRKRLQKFEKPREPEDFGRKGLRGMGLRVAMREVYLGLAEENPDTWFTVDNATHTIEENTALIVDRILRAAGRPVPEREPVAYPEFVRLSLAGVQRGDEEKVRERFYEYVETLAATGREGEAAYHIRSMESEAAWSLREQLVDKVPRVVAYGLGPLTSKRSMEMRRRLIEGEPERIARTIGSAEWGSESDEAWEFREALVKRAPVEVAMSLAGLDSEQAWDLRERLLPKAPGIVLSSLRGIDTPRAWQMRETHGKKKNMPGLLRGLAFIDTDEAWKIRDKQYKNFLPWVILSTLGVVSENAWTLRRRHLENATKLVMRSMAGLIESEAWAMRREAGRFAKESLTTVKGIDAAEAWELRKSLADIWPGSVSKSVGMTLAKTEAGYDFLWEMSLRHPLDPDVVHYLVKAIEMDERRER